LFSFSLSGNKGLCGVPSLPSCPMFWEHGRLSSPGKIAIGLSCLFISCVVLLLVYIYIRRKRNDYDFGLPHEIMGEYNLNEILFFFLSSVFLFIIFLVMWFICISGGWVCCCFICFTWVAVIWLLLSSIYIIKYALYIYDLILTLKTPLFLYTMIGTLEFMCIVIIFRHVSL
jgi:hypothetical protein